MLRLPLWMLSAHNISFNPSPLTVQHQEMEVARYLSADGASVERQARDSTR